MNSSLNLVQGVVSVVVAGGRTILLQSTARDGNSKELSAGEYEFYIVRAPGGSLGSEWAVPIRELTADRANAGDEPVYGLPIKNLRTLTRRRVIEVTNPDGSPYFEDEDA